MAAGWLLGGDGRVSDHTPADVTRTWKFPKE